MKNVAAPTGNIDEKPVDAGLRAPRNLGWGAERKVIACKRCGAHTTLDPHVSSSSCAFCGTSAVVEAPPSQNIARPEGLLPFRITQEAALQSFRAWLQKLWLRPNDLKRSARMNKIAGAYIPFWTFDAATYSRWEAEAGHYYYTGSGKNRQRHVRWEPANGTLERFFDDLPVPASRGIDSNICQAIEPFPTSELTPYDPQYLSGFLAEENAIDLPEALENAKERMRAVIRDLCSKEVPGDTQRNLRVQTQFNGLAYKNCLLPIWVAAYDYNGTPYRYLVNGVTGRCAGTAPWSWVKITLLGLMIFIILMIVLYANNS
ncbi:MAG TPA: zinc ribbon domain-containing protein [Thermoanaerobaculia bacterium]|nr:zinc ribbon domain-containing protein [Thermoanaerobaculia bacterium]